MGGHDVILQSIQHPSSPPTDRRYFALSRDGSLSWYGSEEEHTLGHPPKNRIQLSEYVTVYAQANSQSMVALVPIEAWRAIQTHKNLSDVMNVKEMLSHSW